MTAPTSAYAARSAAFARTRQDLALARVVRQRAAQLISACVHHDIALARELCVALGTTLEAFRDKCRAELARRRQAQAVEHGSSGVEHGSSGVEHGSSGCSTATSATDIDHLAPEHGA